MIASVLVLLDYSFSLLKNSPLAKLLLGTCSSAPQSSPFRFVLPQLEADAIVTPETSITFRPPVYIQRYLTIRGIFDAKNVLGGCKKIVDFGCAEIALFTYVKRAKGVEEYIAVDIDKELVSRYSCRVLPLTFDYLDDRRRPFNVKVLCGSVAVPDVRLLGTDAVVAIELIEHLYPEPLEELPYNIFGIIQPDIAVFTTPNSDFNVLFRDLVGFRHDDHKFEWSREQFKDWADNLVVRYPNYEVEVGGIGPGPPGTDHLGCSTQIAVFFRKGNRTNVDVVCEETYETIREVDYPYRKFEDKLEHTVKYSGGTFIRCHLDSEDYLVDNEQVYEHRIPLSKITEFINRSAPCTELEVREILSECWTIQEGLDGSYYVIVPYGGLDDGWSISSQASSSDRSHLTDLEDYRANCALDSSDWDAEPDPDVLPCHLNGENMSQELQDDSWLSEAQAIPEPPESILSVQLPEMAGLNPDVAAESDSPQPLASNMNQESSIPLPKCQSLEQINPNRNKNKSFFRFSLNMEKSDPFSCDLSSANCESHRDRSVPSFSESFGLRLEDSSQSKAVDSGYPNSFSQEMDMDLTPEQVDEIITETESSFDGDEESVSGDELQEQPNLLQQQQQRQQAHNDAALAPPLRFLDNVENGDVANNNRDGEGNNMEDNRLIGEVMEFVQEVIQLEGDLHPNMEGARAYPDPESDDEAISNTVDGSSQADSTLPMLDDDTIPRMLADRGIVIAHSDAPSTRPAGPSTSTPQTPFTTRNPSTEHLQDESPDRFPSWLLNVLIDDEDEDDLGAGDTDTIDDIRGVQSAEDDVVQDDLEAESEISIEHIVPGDDMGGGDSNKNTTFQ